MDSLLSEDFGRPATLTPSALRCCVCNDKDSEMQTLMEAHNWRFTSEGYQIPFPTMTFHFSVFRHESKLSFPSSCFNLSSTPLTEGHSPAVPKLRA